MSKYQQPKSNFTAKLYSHGKVNIPVTVKSDLNLHDGDEIIFIKKGLSWIVTTRLNWIKEAQEYFKSLSQNKSISIVDEFIEERRQAALKEME